MAKIPLTFVQLLRRYDGGAEALAYDIKVTRNHLLDFAAGRKRYSESLARGIAGAVGGGRPRELRSIRAVRQQWRDARVAYLHAELALTLDEGGLLT